MIILRRRASRTIILTSGAIFLLSLFFNNTASAELDNPDLPHRTGIKLSDMGYRAGNIRIHGAFKGSEELENNIYLAPSKEKFDAITMLKPSFGIEIPQAKNMISADYEGAIYLYGRFPSQDHIDHQARGLVELNLTDYKIKMNEIFRDYTDRSADENSRRIARTVNNFRASVGAEFDKFGFELGYRNLLEIYGSSDDLVYQQISYGDRDRFTNIVDLTGSYRFMPKTSVFLEGDIGVINYYNSSIPPGSIFVDIYLGLKGRPTNKILINLKGGIRYQDYDNSNVYADKSYFGPIARGGLDYLATKDDTLNISLEKGVYESLYANMNYYDANILSLKYTHKFNEKTLVSAYGSYQINLYPSAANEGGVIDKRYDNIYNFGCLGRYDIRKWLSAELKYDFTRKDSRFGIYDYTDNKVSLGGTGGF